MVLRKKGLFMNPYTYSRPRKTRREQSQAAVGAGPFLRDLVHARLSSAIAIAMVVFAAGSVAAMTVAAGPELSHSSDANVLPIHLAMLGHRQLVLGVSTTLIDDAALEAGDPTGSISAKSVSFDSTVGRWDYIISYKVNNLEGSATLSIGDYTVQSGITASGTVETGSILKPSKSYIVTLWSTDTSGYKQRLARYELKTPKAKTAASPSALGSTMFCLTPPVLQPGTNASSSIPSTTLPSLCVKGDNGQLRCTQPHCIPIMRQDPNATSTAPTAQGHWETGSGSNQNPGPALSPPPVPEHSSGQE